MDPWINLTKYLSKQLINRTVTLILSNQNVNMAIKLTRTKHQSYTVSDKLRIISFAKQHGNCAAERELGVSESNVRLWRKSKENLEKTPRLKQSNRGKKAAWPELEVDLIKWITEKRNNGLTILPSLVRLKALNMTKHEKYGIPPGQFKAGNHWCQCFMKWNGISCTAASRWLWGENSSQTVQLSSACYCQQTNPLTFEMPPNRTICNSGEKTIKICTTGNEKNRITVLLACAGDRSKLRPMVIFNKHGVIAAQENSWMDGEIMKT